MSLSYEEIVAEQLSAVLDYAENEAGISRTRLRELAQYVFADSDD
jgi:hypothetical protein